MRFNLRADEVYALHNAIEVRVSDLKDLITEHEADADWAEARAEQQAEIDVLVALDRRMVEAFDKLASAAAGRAPSRQEGLR